MKTKAEKSITYSTISVIVALVPFIGWVTSAILILISLIMAIAAVAGDEKKSVSALVNAILAVPASTLSAFFALWVLSGAGI